VEVAKRKAEALGVFYAALGGILGLEKKRTHEVTVLTGNETFLKSLMAISIEVTAFVGGRKDIAVLLVVIDRLELPAYELSKMLERFVRLTPNLPATVARHVSRCEERILEKLAWDKRSPLLALLERLDATRNSPETTPTAAKIPTVALDFFFQEAAARGVAARPGAHGAARLFAGAHASDLGGLEVRLVGPVEAPGRALP